MKEAIKADLIRIGNSRGVRIPKALIEQCKFGETVRIRVEGGGLVITADAPPRHGWADAFKAHAAPENDALLLEPAAPNQFDNEEWKW